MTYTTFNVQTSDSIRYAAFFSKLTVIPVIVYNKEGEEKSSPFKMVLRSTPEEKQAGILHWLIASTSSKKAFASCKLDPSKGLIFSKVTDFDRLAKFIKVASEDHSLNAAVALGLEILKASDMEIDPLGKVIKINQPSDYVLKNLYARSVYSEIVAILQPTLDQPTEDQAVEDQATTENPAVDQPTQDQAVEDSQSTATTATTAAKGKGKQAVSVTA